MSLLTKDQLLSKDEDELRSVAENIGITNTNHKDKNQLIYDILDTQAELKSTENQEERCQSHIFSQPKSQRTL